MSKKKKGSKAKFVGVAMCFALAAPAILTGCAGQDGANGKDGTRWLSGTETPTMDQGVYGDFYLDTDDFMLYQKTNSEWLYIGSIKGDNGTSQYTHIAYSQSADGTNFKATWEEGYNYIGVAVSNSSIAPTNKASYEWSLFKGAAGANGEDGAGGQNGVSSYLHIRYAALPTGTDMATSWSAGLDYIGVAVSTNNVAPTEKSAYSWAKITGPQGATGGNGQNGTSSYLHIKYKDEANSQQISSTLAESHKYIGFVVTNSSTAPSEASSYSWSKFKGESEYVHIRYSPNADGTGSVAVWTAGCNYIGIAKTTSATPPAEGDSQWKWSRFVGADGADSHVYIAYATNANGDGFSTTWTAGQNLNYIGVFVSTSATQSQDPENYTWALFRGETGVGQTGSNGHTPYVHIRYSQNADGNNHVAEWSEGYDYIGITATYDETAPVDKESYEWIKFKGEVGGNGPQGVGVQDLQFKYKFDTDGNKYLEITTIYTDPQKANDVDIVYTEQTIYAGRALSLADAIEAAPENGTVVLNENVTISETLVVNKQLTLDLKGKSITEAATWATGDALIEVAEGGSLYVKTTDATGTNAITVKAESTLAYGLKVTGGATLTVDASAWADKGVTVMAAQSAVYAEDGTATLLGGTYKALGTDLLAKETGADIIVSGGDYVNFDPVLSAGENLVVEQKHAVWIEDASGDKHYRPATRDEVFAKLEGETNPCGITLTENLMLPSNGYDITSDQNVTIEYNHFEIVPYEGPVAMAEAYAEQTSVLRVHAGAKLSINASTKVDLTAAAPKIALPIQIIKNDGSADENASVEIKVSDVFTVKIAAPTTDETKSIEEITFTISTNNETQNTFISATTTTTESVTPVKEAPVLQKNQAVVTVDSDVSIYDAIEAVADGGRVVLATNVDMNKQIIIDKKVNLDLNGKTVSNSTVIWSTPNKIWSLMQVVAGGELIVDSSVQDATTEADYGQMLAKDNDCYVFDIKYGGKITINHGVYRGNISVVYVTEGLLTVNGGEYSLVQKGENTGDDRYIFNCEDNHYDDAKKANYIVNGGKFISEKYSDVAKLAYNPAICYSEPAGPANFVGENKSVVGYETTVDDTAKIVYEVVADADLETFITEKMTACQGAAVVENGKTWFVATANNMQAAIDQTRGAATMTLYGNVDMPQGLVIGEGKNITVELNECTISISQSTWSDGVFFVNGGALVIEGDQNGRGKVVADNQSVPGDCYAMALFVKNGTATINGGMFMSSQMPPEDDQYDLIYARENATITINGGAFWCQTPQWTLNCKDQFYQAENSKIIVNGGTFFNYDPSNSYTEPDGQPASYVTPGKVVISMTAEGMTNYVVTSFDEAVAAINAAETEMPGMTFTMKLTGDVKLNEQWIITSNLILDLNGKTMTIEQNVGEGEEVYIDSMIRVNDGGKLVIDGNGTIDASRCKEDIADLDYRIALRSHGEGSEIIVNSGNIKNTHPFGNESGNYDLVYASDGGIVTIYGGTFESISPTWVLNVKNETTSEIIVKGGNFIGYDPSRSYTDENPNNDPPSDFVSPDCTVSYDEQSNTYTVAPVAIMEIGYNKFAAELKVEMPDGEGAPTFKTGDIQVDMNEGFGFLSLDPSSVVLDAEGKTTLKVTLGKVYADYSYTIVTAEGLEILMNAGEPSDMPSIDDLISEGKAFRVTSADNLTMEVPVQFVEGYGAMLGVAVEGFNGTMQTGMEILPVMLILGNYEVAPELDINAESFTITLQNGHTVSSKDISQNSYFDGHEYWVFTDLNYEDLKDGGFVAEEEDYDALTIQGAVNNAGNGNYFAVSVWDSQTFESVYYPIAEKGNKIPIYNTNKYGLTAQLDVLSEDGRQLYTIHIVFADCGAVPETFPQNEEFSFTIGSETVSSTGSNVTERTLSEYRYRYEVRLQSTNLVDIDPEGYGVTLENFTYTGDYQPKWYNDQTGEYEAMVSTENYSYWPSTITEYGKAFRIEVKSGRNDAYEIYVIFADSRVPMADPHAILNFTINETNINSEAQGGNVYWSVDDESYRVNLPLYTMPTDNLLTVNAFNATIDGYSLTSVAAKNSEGTLTTLDLSSGTAQALIEQGDAVFTLTFTSTSNPQDIKVVSVKVMPMKIYVDGQYTLIDVAVDGTQKFNMTAVVENGNVNGEFGGTFVFSETAHCYEATATVSEIGETLALQSIVFGDSDVRRDYLTSEEVIFDVVAGQQVDLGAIELQVALDDASGRSYVEFNAGRTFRIYLEVPVQG